MKRLLKKKRICKIKPLFTWRSHACISWYGLIVGLSDITRRRWSWNGICSSWMTCVITLMRCVSKVRHGKPRRFAWIMPIKISIAGTNATKIHWRLLPCVIPCRNFPGSRPNDWLWTRRMPSSGSGITGNNLSMPLVIVSLTIPESYFSIVLTITSWRRSGKRWCRRNHRDIPITSGRFRWICRMDR